MQLFGGKFILIGVCDGKFRLEEMNFEIFRIQGVRQVVEKSFFPRFLKKFY